MGRCRIDLAQYYGGFTDDQLAYFREVAMQDEALFREEFRRFNEEVEFYLQQQDMIVQQQNEMANQQQQQMFEQQQQMFDQQVQMSMGFLKGDVGMQHELDWLSRYLDKKELI